MGKKKQDELSGMTSFFQNQLIWIQKSATTWQRPHISAACLDNNYVKPVTTTSTFDAFVEAQVMISTLQSWTDPPAFIMGLFQSVFSVGAKVDGDLETFQCKEGTYKKLNIDDNLIRAEKENLFKAFPSRTSPIKVVSASPKTNRKRPSKDHVKHNKPTEILPGTNKPVAAIVVAPQTLDTPAPASPVPSLPSLDGHQPLSHAGKDRPKPKRKNRTGKPTTIIHNLDNDVGQADVERFYSDKPAQAEVTLRKAPEPPLVNGLKQSGRIQVRMGTKMVGISKE